MYNVWSIWGNSQSHNFQLLHTFWHRLYGETLQVCQLHPLDNLQKKNLVFEVPDKWYKNVPRPVVNTNNCTIMWVCLPSQGCVYWPDHQCKLPGHRCPQQGQDVPTHRCHNPLLQNPSQGIWLTGDLTNHNAESAILVPQTNQTGE